MAYSELIKSFERTRSYMREFYVYGFRGRDEYNSKSARSYDDERRRVSGWLGDYMSFHRNSSGKQVFLSVDNRSIAHNPLYTAFRAKSFTDRDIVLHFYLLDMLRDQPMTARECIEQLSEKLGSVDETAEMLDESAVRRKLKEYEELGIVASEKRGKELVWSLTESTVDVSAWQDAVDFFSEAAPLGVIGSFFPENKESVLRFKHRYLLDAMDSEILLQLAEIMLNKCAAEVTIFSRRRKMELRHTVFPLRFFMSTQNGRQYLLCYHYRFHKPMFFRLDGVRSVKQGNPEKRVAKYEKYVDPIRRNLWGVSFGPEYTLEHIEMKIRVRHDEQFIVNRLLREKRCGELVKLDQDTWLFKTDVYDAQEVMPWIRTFMGRIVSLECSNERIQQRFYNDLQAMAELYGGDEHAVS